MIGWLKSLFHSGEADRLIRDNATLEEQLIAKLQSPDCPQELADAATIYCEKQSGNTMRLFKEGAK
jgi:hypothetical protein